MQVKNNISEFNIDFLDFEFINEEQKRYNSCIHTYIIQQLKNKLSPIVKKTANGKNYVIIIRKKDICLFITSSYHIPTALVKTVLKEMEFYRLIRRINKQFFEIII